MSGTGSPTQTFHSVQLRGCEMLAHILGKVKCDPDNYSPQFNIGQYELFAFIFVKSMPVEVCYHIKHPFINA